MRPTALFLIMLLVGATFVGCNGDRSLRHSRSTGPTTRGALPAKLERPEPVQTQQLEARELKLEDIDSARLEATLQDLNRRKDHDYREHGGAPGPDAAYLNEWVEKVTAELKRRGYYVDTAGNLHRPGPIVPWR